MARQRFCPRDRAAVPRWFARDAAALQDLAPALVLPPAEVADSVADALYLAYCTGAFIVAVRSFAPGATAAIKHVARGSGAHTVPMPTFEAPPLPAATASLAAVGPVR